MNTPCSSPLAEEDTLLGALLRGDREDARRAAAAQNPSALRARRIHLMTRLTRAYLAGEVPFCLFSATAQAAAALPADGLSPIACCGAVAGNRCAAGKDYMLMLLDAWGVPALDLGVDVPPEHFLEAVLRQNLRFVLCAVFSPEDAENVAALHAAAARAGVRARFHLGICGADLAPELMQRLPLDCGDTRAVPVAEWVVSTWTH